MTQEARSETADLAGAAQPPCLYQDYEATRLRAPKEPLVVLPETLSDTTGPAYGHGRVWEADSDLTRQHEGEPLGERIIMTGRVLDGDGRPVRGGLVEVWQADPSGRYAHSADDWSHLLLDGALTGFGRPGTAEGAYSFATIKPGRVPGPRGAGAQAPHATLAIFARGLLRRAVTRVYFPDEGEANVQDPVLSSVADPALRSTVVAAATAGGYQVDTRLQGDGQTVFFDV